jgi:hypothetical protein
MTFAGAYAQGIRASAQYAHIKHDRSEPDQKPGFLIGNVSYSRNGRTSAGRAQRES